MAVDHPSGTDGLRETRSADHDFTRGCVQPVAALNLSMPCPECGTRMFKIGAIK